MRGQKKAILDLIGRKGEVSLPEIRESMNINYNTIRACVIALTNENLIERVGWGKYQIKK